MSPAIEKIVAAVLTLIAAVLAALGHAEISALPLALAGALGVSRPSDAKALRGRPSDASPAEVVASAKAALKSELRAAIEQASSTPPTFPEPRG